MINVGKIEEKIEFWKNKLISSGNPDDLSALMKKSSNGNNCNKKILVESYGINVHLNNFYLVHQESEHTAVISEFNKQGNPEMTGMLKDHDLQLVNKSNINDETYYHLNDHSLTEWQGNPLEFSFA